VFCLKSVAEVDGKTEVEQRGISERDVYRICSFVPSRSFAKVLPAEKKSIFIRG
jgi:hypothetical protein